MVTTARRWDGTQWVNATARRWDGTEWVTIHEPDPDPDPLPVPALSYSFDGHPYPTHGQAILNSHTNDWVPGRRGEFDQALRAAGWGNDWIEDSPLFNSSTWDGFTLSMWVAFPSISGGNEFRPWGAYSSDGFFAGLGVNVAAREAALWWGSATSARTASIADLDEWVHVAVTWQNGEATIYANATEVGWVAAPDPLPDLIRINVGSGEWGPEACLVDDFRIYATALTPQQVQDDMTAPIE